MPKLSRKDIFDSISNSKFQYSSFNKKLRPENRKNVFFDYLEYLSQNGDISIENFLKSVSGAFLLRNSYVANIESYFGPQDHVYYLPTETNSNLSLKPFSFNNFRIKREQNTFILKVTRNDLGTSFPSNNVKVVSTYNSENLSPRKMFVSDDGFSAFYIIPGLNDFLPQFESPQEIDFTMLNASSKILDYSLARVNDKPKQTVRSLSVENVGYYLFDQFCEEHVYPQHLIDDPSIGGAFSTSNVHIFIHKVQYQIPQDIESIPMRIVNLGSHHQVFGNVVEGKYVKSPISIQGEITDGDWYLRAPSPDFIVVDMFGRYQQVEKEDELAKTNPFFIPTYECTLIGE